MAIITLLLLTIKAVWVLSFASGPTIFNDELRYRLNASAIFELQKYATADYPPGYPALLAPALFFKRWYEAMLLINAFWSSLVVPLTWILARTARLKHPLIAAMLAALLPLHAIYPNFLLSENVFVPLFILSTILALRGDRGSVGESLVFGVVLGFTHLTKYLFLPAIPVLMAAWWFYQNKIYNELESHTWLRKYRSILLVFLAYGSVAACWVLYGRVSGFSWSDTLGFQTFSGAQFYGETFNSFGMWVVVYGSYMVLAWLPMWTLLAIWTVQPDENPWRLRMQRADLRFFAVVISLLVGYGLLAVQHSFRAYNNYPVPQYLIGRYLMHLSPLMVVWGIWAMERITERPISLNQKRPWIAVGGVLGLAFLAWQILFSQGVWPFPPWFASIPFNAVDVIALGSPYVFFAALALALLPWVILRLRRARPQLLALPITALSLLILVASASKIHGAWLGSHARELATVASEFPISPRPLVLHVLVDNTNLPLEMLEGGLAFWGLAQNQFSAEKVSAEKPINLFSPSVPALLLTPTRYDIVPLREYSAEGGETFRIYRVDNSPPASFRPKIISFGPLTVVAGSSFNTQPSGNSAIWFKFISASSFALVTLDGEPLKTVLGKDGFGSAEVPAKLIKTPHIAKFHLHDPLTNSQSYSVELPILSAKEVR